MGNARSQSSRRSKSHYLLYLIHRTWNIVVDHRKDPGRCEDTDRDTDGSSRCSGCLDCAYQQDSFTLDSESDMAPNAEEELLVVKPWGPQPEKERLRPPTYNAEDYAIALRRWGRRPLGSIQDSQGTLPSTTSSSSGYASGSGEMTLRQFTSVSELLNKLRADLRLAFPSFVQEFASPPADGITLLLETLRGVQLAQSSPPSSTQPGPRIGTRRAALDELGCVECLAACGERCADAPRLLVQAQPGLLALAVCLTSSLNRSRVLALQLLTKVCQAPGGHAAVSEAVSTLRLKYGEGGRFRFLAGALLAPRAAIALRVAGVSFLNAFLKSAPRTQSRLYIQAEACEAGLEPQVIQEWLKELDGREEDALSDLLHKEIQKWTRNCVDVDSLQRRAMRAEETCRILSKKISALQSQLQKFQLEKLNSYNSKEKTTTTVIPKTTEKISSNADDEGISSSERSSSPEDNKLQSRTPHQKIIPVQDNDQETTIDDVIEELRIIVKDAEEEFSEKNQEQNRRSSVNEQNDSYSSTPKSHLHRSNSKLSVENSDCAYERVVKRDGQKNPQILRSNAGSNVSQSRAKGEQVTYFGNDRECSTDSSATRGMNPPGSRRVSKSSTEGSVRIVVKGPEMEEAIVPAILHPQPPRRTPACLTAIMSVRHSDFVDHGEVYNSHDEEIEEETLGDGSDSLLSASRLKYNGKNQAYEGEMVTGTDHFQKQSARSDSALPDSNDLEKKYARILDDSRQYRNGGGKERNSIRNYETSNGLQIGTDEVGGSGREIEAYREFDGSSKVLEVQSSRQSNDRQNNGHRHAPKYRSEVEKRKHLRRSASHDYIESSASSPRSRRSGSSKVECRIRKFESLNSFDEHRSLQNYGRLDSSENISKHCRQVQALDDNVRSRMRRSESFHQVSHMIRKEQCSSRGGSDSGLFYITDYNLEPLVTRKARSIDAPKSPCLLTKSLDRIDEGLDSMVDIVITQEKNQWGTGRHQKTRKPRDSKHTSSKGKSSRSESIGNTVGNCLESVIRGDADEFTSRTRQLKNDALCNSQFNNKQLRSDEFYEEQINRQWDYQNELNVSRKNNELDTDDSTVILSTGIRRNSLCQNENINNKFSSRSNDSGIFAGRTYDTFGLGKSRFNAGNYSGNQRVKENPIGRRNTTSSLIEKRGKVTDVVSGLY